MPPPFFLNGWRERIHQSRESCHGHSFHFREGRPAPTSVQPRLQGGAAFMAQLSRLLSDYLPGLFWCLKQSLYEICDTVATRLKLNNNYQNHWTVCIESKWPKTTNPALKKKADATLFSKSCSISKYTNYVTLKFQLFINIAAKKKKGLQLFNNFAIIVFPAVSLQIQKIHSDTKDKYLNVLQKETAITAKKNKQKKTHQKTLK